MVNNSHITARQILSTVNGKGLPKKQAHSASVEGAGRFGKMLQNKMQLKFSKHAQKRLASRNIELSTTDMDKINRAVDTARKKGARDSLVLLNNLALVVSVKNNTVVTAVNEGSQKENVFTNIDSAVIAK